MARKYKIVSAALADAKTSRSDLICRFWIDWTTSTDEGTIRVLNDGGRHAVTSFNPHRQDLDFCRAVLVKLAETLTLSAPTAEDLAGMAQVSEEQNAAAADQPAPPPKPKRKPRKAK